MTLPLVPTSFSLFALLAPELRLKIWQYACLGRVVSLRYIPELDCCLSTSKPPTVLQVCHESRKEALRIYSLSFGTPSSPARTYFSPSHDTLYFPRYRQMGYDETLRDFREFLNEDQKEMLDKVQHIAIDHVDPAIKRPWESYNKAAFMRDLPSLQEVFLILCEEEGKEGKVNGDGFAKPMKNLEELGNIWTEFRQSIVMEEKVLEDISRIEGKEYIQWSLPTVRIRSRAVRLEQRV